MEIKQAQGQHNPVYEDALKIRQQVFIDEQGVDPQIEIDQWEDQAIHYAVYVNNVAVATARLIKEENQTYHMTRVASLKKYRGLGYGKELMDYIERQIKATGGQRIWLSAQLTAVSFYEKLGYQKIGETYEEAGMAHQRMEKRWDSF